MARKPQFPPPVYPKKARPGEMVYCRIWQGGKATDVRLGPKDSPATKAKYARICAELAANDGRPPAPEARSICTVADLCARFWRHAEGYYRTPEGKPGKELEGYRLSMRPLEELYGPTLASDFGPLALKAVRQTMIDAGLCRKVINQRIGRVKRVFKWGVAEELIPATVHQALMTVKGLQHGRSKARETEPVKPVPEADLERTLAQLNPVLRAMADVQLLTSMRPGEVTRLRPQDIDRDSRQVNGVAVWLYRPATHKTAYRGHARTILIGPRAQAILAPYLQGRNPDAYLFSPKETLQIARTERRARRKTPLGKRQRRKAHPKRMAGDCYSVESYGRAIRRAGAKAGAGRWHPHQLRHNAATRLVQEFGWDIARILLGHRTISTTQIYAEDNLQKALEAIARVG